MYPLLIRIKRLMLLLGVCIGFTCVASPSIQAAPSIKPYPIPLTIAAIALHLPYVVHWCGSKEKNLYNRLLYKGDHHEALWNHGLNLINLVSLSREMPAKPLFLTAAILFGLQTTTYVFCNAHGVSLVWSGLTGMLFHRLCIQKQMKWHLLLAILLNSATLVYYSYHAPAVTTFAHLGGVAIGFGLSFVLPYKKTFNDE